MLGSSQRLPNAVKYVSGDRISPHSFLAEVLAISQRDPGYLSDAYRCCERRDNETGWGLFILQTQGCTVAAALLAWRGAGEVLGREDHLSKAS